LVVTIKLSFDYVIALENEFFSPSSSRMPFVRKSKGKTNANQTISLLVHKRLILSPTSISTSTFTSISTSTQKVLHQKETREVVQTRKEDSSSSSSSSGGIVIGV